MGGVQGKGKGKTDWKWGLARVGAAKEEEANPESLGACAKIAARRATRQRSAARMKQRVVGSQGFG